MVDRWRECALSRRVVSLLTRTAGANIRNICWILKPKPIKRMLTPEQILCAQYILAIINHTSRVVSAAGSSRRAVIRRDCCLSRTHPAPDFRAVNPRRIAHFASKPRLLQSRSWHARGYPFSRFAPFFGWKTFLPCDKAIGMYVVLKSTVEFALLVERCRQEMSIDPPDPLYL